jgi:hypothetical protein
MMLILAGALELPATLSLSLPMQSDTTRRPPPLSVAPSMLKVRYSIDPYYSIAEMQPTFS